MLKIAIHDRENSFSEDWIKYCRDNNIPFKLVDCYSNDILKQMEDCDALMWHWSHTDHAAILFARQLTYSLEKMGKKVFPDTNTCRFFDDKIGQKYLFEAMGVPHVPTYIFYDKKKALEWIESAEFPKVFKLSKGAGSANVRLVKTKKEAIRLINIAFGKGFKPIASYFSDISRRVKKKKTFGNILKALLRSPQTVHEIITKNAQMNREKEYVYFQDFIPENEYDIRVLVVGRKVCSILRKCQPNDFRASDSGIKDYSPDKIDRKCLDIARKFSTKMKFQSMAYDFIFNDGQPLLTEMSYSFQTLVYPGYYDENLNWRSEKTVVYEEMLDNLIN